jgi:broad specificity phosphatase PhoE
MEKNITRFGFLRHAMTEWNKEKRIQGHKDSPLTPEGERQARRWADRLRAVRFERILCSDSGRALQTAKIINREFDLPITPDPRLREQDWGRLAGKTLTDLKTNEPETLKALESAGWDMRPPGGEDRGAVRDRVVEALAEAHRKWPGNTMMIVTHEGVMKCLLYHLTNRKFLPCEPAMIRPYHLHWVTMGKAGMCLYAINDMELDG